MCTECIHDIYIEIFDKYLRAHVENFKYKTITTDDWKEFFLSYFDKQVCGKCGACGILSHAVGQIAG